MRSDMKRFAFRVYRWAALAAALFCFAAPASAQYKPRTLDDPATGEKYHIEGGADFWFPTADMVVESEQLGIPGSQIDLKRDLGLVDHALPRAAGAAAAGAGPQAPVRIPAGHLHPIGHAEPGHRVQRDPLSPRPAGELDARMEDLRVRLRVRLRRQELGLRRLRSRGQVHRRAGVARQPDRQRVRARARPDSGDRRHRRATTSSPTSRSPASSPPSRFPTASTTATTRTTSTSTSTAP